MKIEIIIKDLIIGTAAGLVSGGTLFVYNSLTRNNNSLGGIIFAFSTSIILFCVFFLIMTLALGLNKKNKMRKAK